jgi:hypothetical protein
LLQELVSGLERQQVQVLGMAGTLLSPEVSASALRLLLPLRASVTASALPLSLQVKVSASLSLLQVKASVTATALLLLLRVKAPALLPSLQLRASVTATELRLQVTELVCPPQAKPMVPAPARLSLAAYCLQSSLAPRQESLHLFRSALAPSR